MKLISVKSICPVCGVHTTVELTPYELNNYKNNGSLPTGFLTKMICECCRDDGITTLDEVDKLREVSIAL